jgi:hypothetical protein
MKNVLSEIVTKSDNNLPDEINDEDIISIANVAARIAAKFQKINNTYSDPKEYAKKMLKTMEHKKNIAASFIINDLIRQDPGKLYVPAEFKNKITKSMQSDGLYDTTDMTAAIEEEFKDEYISSNDISKALKALEKEIGLNNTKGKDKVKKIRGKQKIEYLGKPSFYKLSPVYESLKRLESKPKAIELIFRSLISMGFFPHLKFFCEAVFYAITDQNKKEMIYDCFKVASKPLDKPEAKVDKPNWELFINELRSMSNDQVKTAAGKIAEYLTIDPVLRQFILLLALS